MGATVTVECVICGVRVDVDPALVDPEWGPECPQCLGPMIPVAAKTRPERARPAKVRRRGV